MMSQVKLYVYDLSNGLARQMSMQFVGKQIDGIWHTSVVVFGKEIFYGQGIHITLPGKSHHGTPLQVIDMGETALDQGTFDEYLTEIREHYTADKYHLLEFNCNSFTNDCIGFLTGGTIPPDIQNLPADFLSTPLGAALRPTIDAMFRRSIPEPAVPPTVQRGGPSTLNSIQSAQEPSALSAPVHICTNSASHRSLLDTHRAVVTFFTSAACGPCAVIRPIFEELAKEHEARDNMAFVMVDLGTGLGGKVASEWEVTVTPSFLFFLNGKLVHRLKGVDARELRTQVDLLIFQLHPPHPHLSMSLPTIESLSTRPILFTQVPTLDVVHTKLVSFIDTSSTNTSSAADAKEALSTVIIPYLKERFTRKTSPMSTPILLTRWTRTTLILAETLPVNSLFPLVDMWRLAVLDSAFSKSLADAADPSDPLSIFLQQGSSVLSSGLSEPLSFILTLLRLLANTFSSSTLAHRIIKGEREKLMAVMLPSLLCENSGVRMAAAGLAFNISAWMQERRREMVRERRNIIEEDDCDWETEMVSALVEAIGRETANEDILHRLTASLAFQLRLSPFYESQHRPLLEVLQVRSLLHGKLDEGGSGYVRKAEVKSLVREVATSLCP